MDVGVWVEGVMGGARDRGEGGGIPIAIPIAIVIAIAIPTPTPIAWALWCARVGVRCEVVSWLCARASQAVQRLLCSSAACAA